MEQLESRLRNHNWKEWIPIYGVYLLEKDGRRSDEVSNAKHFLSRDGLLGFYHAFSGIVIGSAAAYPIYYGMMKLSDIFSK